jgi:hypothetical protein
MMETAFLALIVLGIITIRNLGQVSDYRNQPPKRSDYPWRK